MRSIWRVPAVSLLAANLALGCAGEPPGPADELVDTWIEASGGLDAWKPVKGLRYTVTTVWFDSTEAEVRRRPRFVWGKKRPQRARIERDEAEGHYVQAQDGRGNAWATLDGAPLPPDHKATEEVMYVTGDVMYWIGLPYKLRDPGVNLTYIPRDSTGMEGVMVSFGEGIGLHSGDRYFYYFDGTSPYPIEVHYIEEGRTNVNRTRWSDFEQAGGISYVKYRTWYNEEGRRTKQLIISDVEINPEIDDAMFAPPGT